MEGFDRNGERLKYSLIILSGSASRDRPLGFFNFAPTTYPPSMMEHDDKKDSKQLARKSKSVTFSVSVGEAADESQNSHEVAIPKINSPLWPNPIHYLLIIRALYSRELTSNPFGVMGVGVPILAIAQSIYGFLLIHLSSNVFQGRTIKDNGPLIVITATVASLFLANIVFIIVVLMGAPLSMLVTETYILSVHLSLLAIQPVLVLFRLEHDQLRKFFTIDAIYSKVLSNTVLCSSFFSFVGAWLGVIPIPLDWDRPWQQWPITILTGAYLGGFLGHNIACLKLLIAK